MIYLFRSGTAAADRALHTPEDSNDWFADNSEFFGLFAAR